MATATETKNTPTLPEDAQTLLNTVLKVYEAYHQDQLDQLVIEPNHSRKYPWNFLLEDERLTLQNGPNGPWGKSHEQALEDLPSQDIKSIAHIGVGKDATLLITDAKRFSDAKIVGFELNHEKAGQANITLGKSGLDPHRVYVVEANASEILADERFKGNFDLVVAQCLYQHLNQEGLEKMSQAVANTLKPDGVHLVSDLILADWGAIDNNSPEAQQAHTYIHGDPENSQQLSARLIGWSLRKAHFWESAHQIASTVSKPGSLSILSEKQIEPVSFTGRDNPYGIITTAIQPTIALGVRMSRLNSSSFISQEALARMKAAENWIWDHGEHYVNNLLTNPNIIHTFPTMANIILQKT